MKKSSVQHDTLKIEKILEPTTEKMTVLLKRYKRQVKTDFLKATEDNGF